MRHSSIILNIFLLTTFSFGQTYDYNYNRKICFSNFNGALFIDSINGTVYSQITLASSLNIKLDNIATEKQKKKILSNSENSTRGTFYSSPPKPYNYLLTSTFIVSADTYTIATRKVEKMKEPYLNCNSNTSSTFLFQDSSEFIDLRNECHTSLLKFIEENELIAKIIKKDIDGDKIDEILVVSNTILFGQQDRVTEAAGPQYLIQLLKSKEGNYEVVFSYYGSPANLFYVDLIKFKEQKQFSLVLIGNDGWYDSHPILEILTIGNSTLDNCVQELSY